MTRGYALLLAVAVVAAGCQRNAPSESRQVGVVNAEAERLKGLSTPLRNVGLRNTIRDSGAPCERVDASGYQQEYKQLSMWTAHCSDSGDFAIFVGANGEAQVRQCDSAASLGIPACRKEGGKATG